MKPEKALAEALRELTPFAQEEVERLIERPKSVEHGDFAFPCFRLAKEFRKSPPECARELAERIKLPVEFAEAVAVGPYLNFKLDRTQLVGQVLHRFLGENRAAPESEKRETLVIEYSSPNIAKTFHMGNLRTTLIGHALDQILRFQGYNVISVNHLGDWGTQFGFVWAGCELWGRPAEPSVDDLVALYVRANALRKAQETDTVPEEDRELPNVHEIAKRFFTELEAGNEKALEFWNWCLGISNEYLDQLYRRLGIHFDYTLGESFYRDKLESVEKMLRDSGALVESKGDLGIDLGERLGFVRIFASDGRSLYITRDIAAAIYRYETFSPAKILYVVGAQQSLHFEQLVGVLKRVGHPVADAIVHIPYGWVLGQRTRGGTSINLSTFLSEAHAKALNAYRNEVSVKPEGVDEELVAEAVAIGAMYFYYFSQSNPKDMRFTWDEALNFQGDTGPYLQYALARLNSISSKAGGAGVQPELQCDYSLLTDSHSYELVSHLSQLEIALQKVEQDFDPHHLASYLLQLAKLISRAYSQLRVVGEANEVAVARLTLFCAAKAALRTGLGLIGVPPVERM